MRVGHDAGIEVDKVQALEPVGRAGQRGEQHRGTRGVRWGQQGGEKVRWGGSGGDNRVTHSPAAQLLRSTQHGGQVAQVYLHGGDLRGGVLLQHQVPRGLCLLGVATGEAQVDASILPQQPPAQRQPHAAATARCSASSVGNALPTPRDLRPRALTRWLPSPAPLAPSRSGSRSRFVRYRCPISATRPLLLPTSSPRLPPRPMGAGGGGVTTRPVA